MSSQLIVFLKRIYGTTEIDQSLTPGDEDYLLKYVLENANPSLISSGPLPVKDTKVMRGITKARVAMNISEATDVNSSYKMWASLSRTPPTLP